MGKTVFLCSAYMSTSTKVEIYINQIDSSIKTLKPKFYLIASDTNCKLDFLNNKPNDNRSEKLLEFIFANQLNILNDCNNFLSYKLLQVLHLLNLVFILIDNCFRLFSK